MNAYSPLPVKIFCINVLIWYSEQHSNIGRQISLLLFNSLGSTKLLNDLEQQPMYCNFRKIFFLLQSLIKLMYIFQFISTKFHSQEKQVKVAIVSLFPSNKVSKCSVSKSFILKFKLWRNTQPFSWSLWVSNLLYFFLIFMEEFHRQISTLKIHTAQEKVKKFNPCNMNTSISWESKSKFGPTSFSTYF